MKDYPTFDNSLPFSISDNSSVSVSMNTPLIPTQDPIAQPRMQSMPRQQPQQVQESLMWVNQYIKWSCINPIFKKNKLDAAVIF